MRERASGTILILAQDPAALAAEVQAQMPASTVAMLEDPAALEKILDVSPADVVVLDDNFVGPGSIELMHRLRLRDLEPAILFLCTTNEPRAVALAYSEGAQRCLVRSGEWQLELGPALRHLMRLRRLEEENRRLLTRITEANIMLEERNRRLDEFSSTVAHDIRGPLGGLSMRLEHLIDTQPQSATAASDIDPVMTQLRKALASTERLTEIVQAMYEYARVGKDATKQQRIDLNMLLTEVIHDLAYDKKLEIKIGMGDLPYVWGNAPLLRRLFSNLLSNAVRYAHKPEILINITAGEPIEHGVGTFVPISVCDNGPGISEKDQAHIFSFFSRGQESNSKGDGLGLGLAMVQRIAELHNGKVNLRSTPGEGCCFEVLLPTHAPNE
jgi:two-component system, sensor histidine kinase and response regulator